MTGCCRSLGLEEGEAIVHPWVNKAIEKAQGKVEALQLRHPQADLLKFDDVMNDQRKAIFEQRREFMEADDLSDSIADMRHQVIDDLVDGAHPQARLCRPVGPPKSCTRPQVRRAVLGHEFPVKDWADEEGVDDETIRERL